MTCRDAVGLFTPVCIEAPAPLAAQASYALGELLRGLGLRAEPVRRGDAALYVGTAPEAAPPSALRLRLSTAPMARRPEELGWLVHDGARWPLPVGPVGDHDDAGGIVEADIVRSAFWWLAGVQELGAPTDVHGRFPYEGSLQHRLGDAPGGALRPAVDAYRRWLGDALGRRGIAVPGRDWGGHGWAVALTHDLDAPAERRLRALLAETGRGRPLRALRRAFGPDRRRRSTQELVALGEALGARPTVFVKTGDGAPEDLRLPRRDPAMQALLRSGRVETGLHPSFAAYDDPRRLGEERDRLAALVGAPTGLVRMHYLRWREPASPGLVARAGFAVDATLGFSEAPGYRRGTAFPFRLWNHAHASPAPVWEAPLTVMDTTLRRLHDADMGAYAEALRDAVGSARAVGGCAVVLAHNDPGEGAPWQRRLRALREVVAEAASGGARVGGLGEVLGAWGVEASPQTA